MDELHLFDSAYDTDDVPYRLLTLGQMAGVLVLAAGVHDAFVVGEDFALVTIGYLVMRVPLVVQWLRAARDDPERRPVAVRYAAGVAVVQAGWLLRFALLAMGVVLAGLVAGEVVQEQLAGK